MTTAVVLMAYGSPASLDQVGDYLRDIRGGRPVSEQSVQQLVARYERIGCPSPLLDITNRQAQALSRTLGTDYRVFVGMKHWAPRIEDVASEIVDEKIDDVIGIALAPHYSRISIGGYERKLRAALNETVRVRMVHHWFEQPAFIGLVASNLRSVIGERAGGTRVFFTAHSLPQRILAEGDPYKDQLVHSAKLIADLAGVPDWELAFQSASATGEPWLGPDIVDALRAFGSSGGSHAVIAPIGFVADHLEILYDVDVECVRAANELGISLARIPSPNDHPELIAALAAAVKGVA